MDELNIYYVGYLTFKDIEYIDEIANSDSCIRNLYNYKYFLFMTNKPIYPNDYNGSLNDCEIMFRALQYRLFKDDYYKKYDIKSKELPSKIDNKTLKEYKIEQGVKFVVVYENYNFEFKETEYKDKADLLNLCSKVLNNKRYRIFNIITENEYTPLEFIEEYGEYNFVI